MRSIWFRERSQDLWTMSKRSRGELQLSISRPEGCADRKSAKIRVCTAQDIHSLHNEGPALQESRSTHQMQAQGVAAASVRGHVVPQLRLLSENAEHLAPRARPGPLDHVQH